MSEETKNPEWKPTELPAMLSRMEGILHLTAWCMKHELKRQEQKFSQVKELFEAQLKEEAIKKAGK